MSTAFAAVCVAFAKQVFPAFAEAPFLVAIGVSGIGGLSVAGFMLVVVRALTLAKIPGSDWARRSVHSGGCLMTAAFPLVILFVILYMAGLAIFVKD